MIQFSTGMRPRPVTFFIPSINSMPLPEILATLTPLLIVSRISGFQLFSIDPIRGKSSIKSIDFAFIFLTTITNFVIGVAFWLSGYDPGIHNIAVMKYSLPILMLLNHIGNILAVTWIFVNRRKVMKILVTLADIDEKLMKLDKRIDHVRNGKHLRIIIIAPILMMWFLSFCCFLFHGWDHFHWDMLMQLFILWIFMITLVMYFHLFIGISGIAQRFQLLQKLTTEMTSEHVRRIQDIHLKISDSVAVFNSVYGPMMIFYFGSCFCWLCLTVFAVAMYINVGGSNICGLACVIAHCLITVTTCFLIVRAAEDVARLRQKMIKNLYKMVARNGDNVEFCRRIRQLQSQMSDVKLIFSCGFFDINWKFVFKVSAYEMAYGSFNVLRLIPSNHILLELGTE